MQGYQVVRTFFIKATYQKGKAVEHIFTEVAQWWCNEKGQEVQIARLRYSFSYYYDNWSLCSPLEVRKKNIVYEHITYGGIYPYCKVLPIFRRNGFNNDFYKTKKAYFGICFTDGEIEVSVLDSIKAYKEEGKAMQHCVYQNEYFDRKDSLILSATIKGERIETIEVSLTSLQIIQARGVKNQISEYHDRIISLVNANTHLILERMTA